VYRLNLTKAAQRKSANAIKKMYPMEYTGYVYDLTTENHHFQAGVGEIVCHNTDSIFIKFHHNVSGEKITGRQALPLAIKAGQLVEKEIKAIMPAHQNLAYEKTLWPFIILSKKRYVGNLYEDNINKFKQKSMGIVLKRRDNAPIVKKVYGGIIDILLNKSGGLAESVEFLQQQLQDMVDGKVQLEDLIISKTLRGTYKDPSKIAHKVLARRMGERDAGNKPQVNDRIPYVYIKTPDGGEQPKLQGDRIEHPDYIRQEMLTPDYYHYITNQIMKPVLQIYALCVEKLPGYSFSPDYWTQIDVELASHRLYGDDKKRKDRICALKEREAEDLLFAPYLMKLCPEKAKPKARQTRKKLHALEHIQEDETAPDRPEFIMRVACKQESKPKRFRITITVTDPQSTEVWKNETEMKYTKYKSLTLATENAFKTLYTEVKGVQQGRLRIFTEKLFVSKWKTAYNNIDDLTQKLRKTIEEANTGSFDELQEIQTLVNLVGFHDTVPYTIEANEA
jgi:hypothetical protein